MTQNKIQACGAVFGTLRSALGGAAKLALIAALPLALGATSVHANDGQSWMRFGNQDGDSRSYDRSFARRWEANPPRGYPTLSRKNIAATKAAIARYAKIVSAGGWRPLPKLKFYSGSQHASLAGLRQHLSLTGDLKGAPGKSTYFGYELERALKRFQARHGLSPTGVVDRRTISALNVSAKARLRQLRINLGRLRSLAQPTKRKYVVVNIPAAQLEAVNRGRVVSRHSVVVGKIDRRTPVLSSRIHQLNFNPVWTLPPTVINKDLIPKGLRMARRGKSVLVKYGIDAYGGNGRKLDPAKVNWSGGTARKLVYRQKPGPQNPLGFLKLNFHNRHSVYLHDTPSQKLFGRNFRAASSGCVRVQNIEQLATWLLSDNINWTRQRVLDMRKNGKRKNVSVKRPVTLHLAYVTAWATEDGVVQFRRDIYQRDGIGSLASKY